MIFVTIGTHPDQFDRLIRRIDEIAPKIKEKIIVQTGFTNYKPKNVEHFEFADSIDKYFKDARLVVSQAATSVLELVFNHNKPIILVPRQKKFKEHINDHQVEFAQYFSKKMGVTSIINIKDLTPELLKGYDKRANVKKDGLIKLQGSLRKIIENNGKN